MAKTSESVSVDRHSLEATFPTSNNSPPYTHVDQIQTAANAKQSRLTPLISRLLHRQSQGCVQVVVPVQP